MSTFCAALLPGDIRASKGLSKQQCLLIPSALLPYNVWTSNALSKQRRVSTPFAFLPSDVWTSKISSKRQRVSPLFLSESRPKRKQKQRIAAIIVGTGFFSQLLVPLYVGLARLGVVNPPPINAFTDITNAAMEEAVRNGIVQPLFATAWAQAFWLDLLSQYNAAPVPGEFLTSYCTDAAHVTWCAVIH